MGSKAKVDLVVNKRYEVHFSSQYLGRTYLPHNPKKYDELTAMFVGIMYHEGETHNEFIDRCLLELSNTSDENAIIAIEIAHEWYKCLSFMNKDSKEELWICSSKDAVNECDHSH
jgi:hypothetical protein